LFVVADIVADEALLSGADAGAKNAHPIMVHGYGRELRGTGNIVGPVEEKLIGRLDLWRTGLATQRFGGEVNPVVAVGYWLIDGRLHGVKVKFIGSQIP